MVTSTNRILTGLPAMLLAGLLACCATVPPPSCEDGRLPATQCPVAGAVDDPYIDDLAARRQWYTAKELSAAGLEPVETARVAEIPIQQATGKLIPPTDAGAQDSLIFKLWLIEQARHTVDAAYYILSPDLAGYALLGALCDAVQRGVDVRLVVDAAGSLSLPKAALRMLETCEDDAGFMVTADGTPTRQRARVQVALFNAITNLSASPNRRSHDKLLITDGEFTERAYIVTGGRNVALDYYALTEEGAFDPHAYRDLELLLRPLSVAGEESVGKVSSDYFSLLFLFRGNRLLDASGTDSARKIYATQRARAREALATVRSLPGYRERWERMPQLASEGFRSSEVLLAHDMANLANRRVVRRAMENYENSPNSILFVLNRILEQAAGTERSLLCSPYLFLALYEDKDGQVLLDEAEEIRSFIEANPEAVVEIVTNSPLTADNFPAQAVIDFDMAPRLLLDPELRQAWLDLKAEDEMTAELTRSEAWRRQVNHPQIHIYEFGLNDSDLFPGGTEAYGKLHAKFWTADEYGFVGTTNFDYRSRLYNNEMGYFFHSEALAGDLVDIFEDLKLRAYRWGSPEWLQMRQNLMAIGGKKGRSLQHQRRVYRTLKATGLDWLF